MVVKDEGPWWRPGWSLLAGRARLISGIVLSAFVIGHLLNHSLGLISVSAMQMGAEILGPIWGSFVGQTLLVGAMTVHGILAFKAILGRRGLRMRVRDAIQIVTGLAIPLLLASHIVANWGAPNCCGTRTDYLLNLHLIWPGVAIKQSVLVVVVWVHLCLGLHGWLGLKPWYERWRSFLLLLAVLIPTLSLLGFVAGGREVARLKQDQPEQIQQAAEIDNWPDGREFKHLAMVDRRVTQAYLITVVILLAAWGMRATATLRQRRFAVIYPSGKKVRAPQGLSVLDVSRLNKIPHASVCGGRGRCSTCRVRVVSGLETLPEPSSIEAKVLGRLGYPERVRLACQLYPRSDLSIVPIVAPPTALRDALGAVDPSQGVEREIAVLFADIRDFTRLAEGKLPYDVVYLLNQYSRQMGEQIEAAGGHLDKFIGDGVMALFGINDAPETAARSALTAAQGMGTSLEELNESLASDLNEPLRIGIGLHMGSSIVGEIGYGRARQLTAIGDAVNVASRLEGLTKERRVQLVVSEQLITRAGIDAPDLPREDVAIRGRTSKLAVRLVERAADLHSSSGPEPPAA